MNWANLLDYDPNTGIFIWKPRLGDKAFNTRYAGKRAGYRTQAGYICIVLGKKNVPAHRVAWFLVYGDVPQELDHIDRDKSNNRIANLRLATRSQNCANRAIFKRQKVGVKGISYDKKKKLYRARIQVGKKRINLGRYKSLAAAREAYSAAATKFFGSFAHAG